MIERELTFLAKHLPEDIGKYPKHEMLDIYIPHDAYHPSLRVRKKAEKYEITKKVPVDTDVSVQRESTIVLTPEEFQAFSDMKGKQVWKDRYLYPFEKYTAEIDVFLGDLTGLILIEFEFQTEEEKLSFTLPEFCLVEITQEEFIAGGFLAGKKYSDIEADLDRYQYQKILLD